MNQEEWQLLHSVQKEILANIPQVVITQGKAGGDVYLFSQHAFHYEGQQVRALDATGAGDAFAAGKASTAIHRVTATLSTMLLKSKLLYISTG